MAAYFLALSNVFWYIRRKSGIIFFRTTSAAGVFYQYETWEDYWAYWSRYIYVNRYMDAPTVLYQQLYELVKERDYFVITTNVDHCFQKAGFDKKRLYYTQGGYGLFQCGVPCHDKTYDNEETVRAMVDMQLKKLGFGTMRLPLTNPEDVKSIDYEQMCQMVDYFLEQGFSYFDTAYPYHGECSEGAVKRCLVERYPRERYILADKMPILRVKASEEYPKYFEEQLRRCGVEYFDYYLLHNMGKERYANTLKYGGFEFICRLKEQKLVKNIGFSYHDDAELLDEILTKYPEMDFVQLQINYLDWDSAAIQSGACYEVACRHGKPVIAMEPVKGGSLANLPMEARNEMEKRGAKGSPASYAIRYAASLENCMMVLSGMSNLEQLLDNTSYMKDFQPLDEKEQEMLRRITDIVNSKITPCTNCKYCMEECPGNINIPAYLGLYNMYAATGKKTNMYYERHSMNFGKASDCIKCGKCERICPQHIEIRGMLEKFADLYEQNEEI